MNKELLERFNEIATEWDEWYGWEEGYTWEEGSDFFMSIAEDLFDVLEHIEEVG